MKIYDINQLWDAATGAIYSEAVLCTTIRPPRLAFMPEAILAVRNHATGQCYEAGKDYCWQPGTRELIIPEGSAITLLSESDLYPPADSIQYPEPGCIAISGGPDGRMLRFSPDRYFLERQVEVDYITAQELPQLPQLPKESLPRFRKRLIDKASSAPLRITAIGDSITEGYNASGWHHFPPCLPNYLDRFQMGLSRHFGKLVELQNRAIGGTGCQQADDIAEKWLGDEPELLIVAYGMNDYHRMTAEEFIAQNQRIVERAREKCADTECLIVLPMTGNPEWRNTPAAAADAFAEATVEWVEKQDNGVALADVRSLWCNILERKSFYDLTGNGVNHPNDYGHAIYATVLLSLFCN